MSIQKNFNALVFLTVAEGVLDIALDSSDHLLELTGETLLTFLDYFGDIGV